MKTDTPFGRYRLDHGALPVRYFDEWKKSLGPEIVDVKNRDIGFAVRGDEEDSDGTDFAHNSNNSNPDRLQLPTGIGQENVSNWRQVIDAATQPGERGSLHFSVAVDYSVSYSA